MELLTRRFFCDNPQCRQHIFCERLPSLVGKYARRTIRLGEALTLIGFALSGEAGGRLTLQIGMRVSPDTLLRLVRKKALHEVPTPRVLGVDDFAFRRGRSFGRISGLQAKKTKGSRRWRKLQKRKARMLAKSANRVSDNIHKATRQIAAEFALRAKSDDGDQIQVSREISG
jgi:hypothetical protein